MLMFLLLYLTSTRIFSKVSWKLSTIPAIFGQNIVLVCIIDDKLLSSRDCLVRQWSGGPDHKGLVYNGYSSNETKYGEYLELESDTFSLIIKNLSESDVNVLYTCSCGFDSFTNSLSMEENTFHYPPTTRHMSFSVEKGLLHVVIDFEKVFPMPICWLYIGVTLKSKLNLVKYHISGIVYSSIYELEYQLHKQTCKNELMVKCEFNGTVNPVNFTENVTTNCQIYIQQVNTYTPNTTHVSFENQTSRQFTMEIYVVVPSILVTLLVIIVLIFCLYRNSPPCKGTATTEKPKEYIKISVTNELMRRREK